MRKLKNLKNKVIQQKKKNLLKNLNKNLSLKMKFKFKMKKK